MNNLIGRVQNILLTPKTEWPVIAAEAETIGGLFTRYILIVSALGPVAMFLKSTLIGISVPFVGRYRVDMATGLEMLVLSYVGGLIGVYVLSLVINALAPNFGAQKDSVQALKAAAYSSTAVWVAGLGNLIPVLGVLLLLASLVYCIYLLYLGLQQTMKCPADKAGGYTAVSIIVAIVVWIVFSYIVSSVTGFGRMGALGAATSSVTPSGSFEKGTTGAAIEDWAKNMEAAGKAVEDSAKQNNGAPSAAAIGAMVGAVAGGGKGVDALPTDQMKTFLPETLGGLPRTGVSASRNAAMGFQVAEASADYADASGKSLRLEVNDAGGAKGVCAGELGRVEEEREWQGIRKNLSRRRAHGPASVGIPAAGRRVQPGRRRSILGRLSGSAAAWTN